MCESHGLTTYISELKENPINILKLYRRAQLAYVRIKIIDFFLGPDSFLGPQFKTRFIYYEPNSNA